MRSAEEYINSASTTERNPANPKHSLCKVSSSLAQSKIKPLNAINQYAISVINYHVGVQKPEPRDFEESVRNILMKYKIIQQPTCLQRLYLPRNELGLEFCSAELRSEQMLFDLKVTNQMKHTSSLRYCILRASHLTTEEVREKVKARRKLSKDYQMHR